jgi:hypothetical protein
VHTEFPGRWCWLGPASHLRHSISASGSGVQEPPQASHVEQAPPQQAPAPASTSEQEASLYLVTENELVVHELLLQGESALCLGMAPLCQHPMHRCFICMPIAESQECCGAACTGDEALHTVKDLSPEQLAEADPLAAMSRRGAAPCVPSSPAPERLLLLSFLGGLHMKLASLQGPLCASCRCQLASLQGLSCFLLLPALEAPGVKPASSQGIPPSRAAP